MKQYLDMLRHIQANGIRKMDRTGTGTTAVFGYQNRYNLQDGFPLLTTKKVFLKGIIHELLWFLAGDTNIRYLQENGVKIWDEWADENGELGPVYGYMWRSWPGKILIKERGKNEWAPLEYVNRRPSIYYDAAIKHEGLDQISNVIQRIKSKPDDRRLIVTAWNPADVDTVALPPCHCFFQFYTRELTFTQRARYAEQHSIPLDGYEQSFGSWRFEDADLITEIMDVAGIPRRALDCQLYQRSADSFLGAPFNIASYALLTMMMAQVCGMVAGEFVHTFGDAHIYSNHGEQVALQLTREPKALPTMHINPNVKSIFDFKYEDFTLEGYDPHPSIAGAVSV